MRKYLGRIRRYVRRLVIWRQVAHELRGRTHSDQAILERAIRNRFRDSFTDIDTWRDPMVDEDFTVVSALGTFNVRAQTDDLYHVLPSREPAVMETIRRLLGPNDCFVDAGANIGAYSQFAAGLCRSVIAIEMMPETAAILRSHVPDTVRVVEKALSDQAGQVVRATAPVGKHGQARIADDGTVAVETATLTEILTDVRHVKLLKMDLEGAELKAIRGAPLDKIEAIIFEDWGDDTVSKWLSEHEYSLTRLDGNNSLAKRAVADA